MTKKTLYNLHLSNHSEEKDGKFRQQILKLGKWRHPKAKNGWFECTQDMIKELITNFKAGIYGKNIPVTDGHPFPVDAAGKNIGKIVDIIETDKGADAVYEVNDDYTDKIKKGEIEEVSPSIEQDAYSPDLDKNVGSVIKGLALVNGPFQSNMDGAVPLSKTDQAYNIINLSLKGDNMEKEEVKETKTEETEKEDIVKEVEKKVEEKKTSSNEDKKTTEPEDKSSGKEEEAKPQESVQPKPKPKTNKELVDALRESEGTNAELKQANRLSDAKGKVKEFVSKGQLAPAEEDIALSIAASDSEVVNLSNNKSEKLSDMFFKFIGERKPIVDLSSEVGVVDAGGQLAANPSGAEQSFIDTMLQSQNHITEPKEKEELVKKARTAYKQSVKAVKQFRKKE